MKFKEKLIGSHNTMTYLKPTNWLLYLGYLISAKCQNKTLVEQINSGVRVLDIRVFPEYIFGSTFWRYGHGLIKFTRNSPSIYNIANTINDMAKRTKKPMYMRIILERCKSERDVQEFINLCEHLELNYPYVTFLGGNRKKDWKKC